MPRIDPQMARMEVQMPRIDPPMTRKEAPMTRMGAPMTRKEVQMTRMEAQMTRKEVQMARMGAPMTRKEAQMTRIDPPMTRIEVSMARKETCLPRSRRRRDAVRGAGAGCDLPPRASRESQPAPIARAGPEAHRTARTCAAPALTGRSARFNDFIAWNSVMPCAGMEFVIDVCPCRHPVSAIRI